MQHQNRLTYLRQAMSSRKLDSLLVTRMPNVFYLTGFTGSTAAVVVTPSQCFILVDPRYSVQARAECPTAEVIDFSGKSNLTASADLAQQLAPSRLGFEADYVSVGEHAHLRKALPTVISLRSTRSLVEDLRACKDETEVAAISRCAEIADQAFEAVLGGVRRGMSEREVALLVDSSVRTLGADREAFETIAAFGPNSACPHASPTDATIEDGGFLKLDFGARAAGYNSDITRTIAIGQPSAKQKTIHSTVLEAQMKAIDAIAPGRTGREIDSVAREHITTCGYGDNFGHGLGHALGIEVHDGPGLSQTSELVLATGMVLTVEPGIYIEGWGGVRIEDDVLVTENGARVLTKAPKHLISI